MSNTGMTVQQAIDEAHRCMLCHDAPCSVACPGGTDPARFIRQIRFYNFKGAARTVLGNNPLGEVCAFVCPTEESCVGACLRAGLDRPIEGPAGLAAAAKLVQYGYAVTVFEARPDLGGMLRYGVPRARLPIAVLEADLANIRDLGVTFRPSAPIEGENGALRLLDEGFAAVFVAPGLWKPYRLDLPGMDAKGVSTAIEFLATGLTDPHAAANLVRDRNVAVIGGGSVAMDVAHTAKLLGANRIYSIALESMTELPAAEREFDSALAEGVIFKPQCQVTRVLVEDGAVSGVEGVETEWIEPGKLVPSNARPIEGTFFRLRVGAVILSIGQGLTQAAGMMAAAAGKAGAMVSVDPETQATKVERIFAGGDFSRGAGTVVDAVGDGKRAAAAIHEFLTSKGVSA
ncbi:MAG: FAD-dependent oxidoreductase [Deltaproteobacteria bacterium]|nr:FAD-dependent oxidoreductase [Deltaproteobacteria bacterium]